MGMGPSGGTAAGYASTSLGTTGPEDPVHIYAATSHPLLHYKVGKNTKAKNRPYSPMRPRNTPYPTKSKCQTPDCITFSDLQNYKKKGERGRIKTILVFTSNQNWTTLGRWIRYEFRRKGNNPSVVWQHNFRFILTECPPRSFFCQIYFLFL